MIQLMCFYIINTHPLLSISLQLAVYGQVCKNASGQQLAGAFDAFQLKAEALGDVAAGGVGYSALYLDPVDVQLPEGIVAQSAHGAGYDASAQKIPGEPVPDLSFFVGPVGVFKANEARQPAVHPDGEGESW